VVFCGAPDAANREAVERFGEVAVIGEIPILDPLDAAAMAALGAKERPRFPEAGYAEAGHG
jgi:hypothetical protein